MFCYPINDYKNACIIIIMHAEICSRVYVGWYTLERTPPNKALWLDNRYLFFKKDTTREARAKLPPAKKNKMNLLFP